MDPLELMERLEYGSKIHLNQLELISTNLEMSSMT